MYPNFIGMVEELGGEIVADEFQRGSRYYDGEVQLNGNPLQALAERYVQGVPHSFFYPDKRRIENILASVKEQRALRLVPTVPHRESDARERHPLPDSGNAGRYGLGAGADAHGGLPGDAGRVSLRGDE